MAKVGGFGTGFDSKLFKESIKKVMKMGLPETTNLRPTFRWTTVKTFGQSDSGGKAWTKNSSPVTTVSHADVQIDCAVQFIVARGGGVGNMVGEFNNPHVIITVLDTDYALVGGANKVLLGGDTYNIDYVEPPIGLFDVTVYNIHCTAQDET